jgi:3-dehydroquinate synthase
MKTLFVRHALGEYPVVIGSNLENKLVTWLSRSRLGPRLVLLSHPEIMQLYGWSLIQELHKGGFEVIALTVPSGEENKSLEETGRLYCELSRNLIERGTPLLALGGGVIGDLGGFVAATYMRGIPLVQIPTTLLAQVDSSIGGKTAVNCGNLKNQVGVFYPPRAVFSDLKVLTTLPPEQINNGIAEMLKCGVVKQPRLFSLLEKRMESVKALDNRLIGEAVLLAASVKTDIVSRDEREKGLRQVLNLGHTVGHAVESVTDFGISHGSAVAIGLAAACRIANRLKLLHAAELGRIIGVINLAGLPSSLPDIDPSAILGAMKHDKKSVHGKLKFVLPVHIGQVVVRNVEPEIIAEVLSER